MATIPFTMRQLEYFDAIASAGSLAAAASRCNVSASALALALDDLENHLALRLFIRRKARGVSLTPAGLRLLSHARQVLSGAETLAAEAWQVSSALRGRLAVGCFPTLAPFFLPGIMQGFQRRHPEVELDLIEAPAPALDELLLQGRIDVALKYRVDVSDRFAFDPVEEFRPYVLVAADHPLAGRERIQLGELVADPLIRLDLHPSMLNTEQIFSVLDLKPRLGTTATNFELVRCLVGRGLGYAVLFQRPASTVSYDGNHLAVLELEEQVPGTVVGLARPVDAPRTVRHDALLAHFGVSSRDAEKSSGVS